MIGMSPRDEVEWLAEVEETIQVCRFSLRSSLGRRASFEIRMLLLNVESIWLGSDISSTQCDGSTEVKTTLPW
jgi:hypothetical protein